MKRELLLIYKNISPSVITTSGLMNQLNPLKMITDSLCKDTKIISYSKNIRQKSLLRLQAW